MRSKRAQGGSHFDLDRLVALCPPCHAQTNAPYVRGRLVVTPLGCELPLTRSMVLGHAPPEKQRVVVTLDEERNDGQESSIHVSQ